MATDKEVSSTSDPNNELDKETLDWIQLAVRIPVAAALHPFEYTKILIQLGHEPIAPRSTLTFFGRPALALPNIFEYFGHIRQKVGIWHMYRGVVPRVMGIITHSYVQRVVSKKTAYLLNSSEDETEETDDELEGNLQSYRVLRFFQATIKSMVSQGAAVIASHPFHVITVRMVAQYIGGDEAYEGLYSTIKEIFRESGFSGFLSGLMPRLIGEMLALWICTSLTFVFNTYLIKDRELKPYTGAVMSLVSSTVTYPYFLVSRVMMVNGSQMVASLPPHMPHYVGWPDCWHQLKAQNQLKRGSSILWRYYTGPVGLRDGKQFPLSIKNFQKPSATRYQ